jgi:predicted phage-related endonuclease
MPLTPEQLLQRKHFVGASEAAAFVGLSPYRSTADVVASKTMDLAPMVETDQMALGNLLEGPIGDWYAEATGRTVTANPDSRCKGIFGATPDFLLWDNLELVGLMEAKTASLLDVDSRFAGTKWGDPGTDVIPIDYWVQAQQQAFVYGMDEVDVCAWLSGGRVIYNVPFDPEMWEMIEACARRLWINHVQNREPLPNLPESLPSLEILQRIQRVPGKVAQVSSHLEKYKEARQLRLLAEHQEKYFKQKLYAEMGDCDTAVYQQTKTKALTMALTPVSRKGYTVEAKTYMKEKWEDG